MRLTTSAVFLLGFYCALVFWWIVIFFSGQKDSLFNLSFALAYALIPLFGGVCGIYQARKWGMQRSAMGKALLCLSLGLITWSLGELIWSYYNIVLSIEVPYPSWADASFILSWPLWTLGIIYLSSAIGAKFGLRGKKGKSLFFIIPFVVMVASYYLVIQVARQGSFELGGGVTKILFDLAYPIWDIVILTVALLVYGLSRDFLGGKMKWAVIITLFGFVVNYFADIGFSYATTIGTHYNGNWVDLLFTTAVFVLSFGINSFDIKN